MNTCKLSSFENLSSIFSFQLRAQLSEERATSSLSIEELRQQVTEATKLMQTFSASKAKASQRGVYVCVCEVCVRGARG